VKHPLLGWLAIDCVLVGLILMPTQRLHFVGIGLFVLGLILAAAGFLPVG
jgi:hypothetical protein